MMTLRSPGPTCGIAIFVLESRLISEMFFPRSPIWSSMLSTSLSLTFRAEQAGVFFPRKVFQANLILSSRESLLNVKDLYG
jgi:hypothetical protein